MATDVYLGLGSNRGEKLDYLKQAVSMLDSHDQCKVLSYSSVYETTPYGKKDQDNFLNAVVKISTDLELKEFFSLIKQFEVEIGRSDFEHWGPREIDIDILLFGELVYADQTLSIPHIELTERDFVLKPLLEVEPELTHPAFGMKLSELEYSITKKHIVKKYKEELLINSGEDVD